MAVPVPIISNTTVAAVCAFAPKTKSSVVTPSVIIREFNKHTNSNKNLDVKQKKEANKKQKEKERLEKLSQGKFDYLTDEEFEVVQKTETLTKLNKSDQVNMLMELGLSAKEIKKLKYEADRVNKIIELTKNQ